MRNIIQKEILLSRKQFAQILHFITKIEEGFTMENTIIVLKRSNGMYGIYINGNKQENLVSNASLTDKTQYLIDRLIIEQAKYPDAKIIFTDKEECFKSGLPSLQEYLGGITK
jgi:hypothetical protein